MTYLADILQQAKNEEWTSEQLQAQLPSKLMYPAPFTAVTSTLWHFFYVTTMPAQLKQLEITVEQMPLPPQGIAIWRFSRYRNRIPVGMLLVEYIDIDRTLFEIIHSPETASKLDDTRIVPLIMLHSFLPFFERRRAEHSTMPDFPRADQTNANTDVGDAFRGVTNLLSRRGGRKAEDHNEKARARAAAGESIDDILPSYMRAIGEKDRAKARHRLREALKRTK